MVDLAVIILASNEKLHIGRCVERLAPLAPKQIFVIDCFSTDGTQDIARSYGATVVEHAWPGLYAPQFNWALDHCPITTRWVLRLDADEYLSPEAIAEVRALLPTLSEDINAIALPLSHVWMKKIIKRGTGKIILTRFFRYGIGRCEERLMDEHIAICKGKTVLLNGAFVDDNLNNLSWWTQKHVGYALREAVDLLNVEYGFLPESKGAVITGQAADKRAKKLKYAKLPLFWRSFAYFLYRYVARGGFLDGKEGFLWHFLQGWWYRTLVDAKVLEIKRRVMSGMYDGEVTMQAKLKKCLKEDFGFNVGSE